ncbi:MAG: hypothetical protein VX528_08710, partial [Candidatus Latescibacterota bacterium]|nr:hypothetical protein [Candidatus Latescibacterota bacterium]
IWADQFSGSTNKGVGVHGRLVGLRLLLSSTGESVVRPALSSVLAAHQRRPSRVALSPHWDLNGPVGSAQSCPFLALSP